MVNLNKGAELPRVAIARSIAVNFTSTRPILPRPNAFDRLSITVPLGPIPLRDLGNLAFCDSYVFFFSYAMSLSDRLFFILCLRCSCFMGIFLALSEDGNKGSSSDAQARGMGCSSVAGALFRS
jgi:hypothetical protein